MSSLISTSFVKQMMGLPGSSEDKKILEMIQWVTSKAESICKRKLTNVERTVQLDGNGRDIVILPVIPVTEVASLWIDADREFDDEYTDYYLNSETGIIYLKRVTPMVPGSVKVTYTAGYTTATIPSDMKMACLEAVIWNLSRLNDNAFGIRSHTTPDGVNLGYEMVLPMASQRVFENYADRQV